MLPISNGGLVRGEEVRGDIATAKFTSNMSGAARARDPRPGVTVATSGVVETTGRLQRVTE